MKILIVDDEAANVELLKAILELSECSQVIGTTNPMKAVDIYSQYDIDVVLLDLNMPYLNGFDVLEQFRGVLPHKDPAIIILTGDHDPDILELAKSKGVRSVITKPFSPRDILDLLDELQINS